MTTIGRRISEADDLLEMAWVIIANGGVHKGGWESQDPEWVEAATNWRDEYFGYLDEREAE